MALAVALFPIPSVVDARSLIAATLVSTFPFFPSRHLTLALGRTSARYANSTESADEETVRAAFVDGRESVVSLVRQARQDALRQLELLGPRLDARLGELAMLRIQEVDRRLGALEL